jgi:CBS domain-containing protein
MSLTLATDPAREMLSLETARVCDTVLRKPFYVDGALDIVSVCRQLAEQGLTHALVRDGERLGIFTTTDLRDAMLRPEPPHALAVREVSHFELLQVQADAGIFEALLLMVRHRVHRVVVRDDAGAVAGVLAQLDLVTFMAHHSHIVALQIDQAQHLQELQEAAARIDHTVELLHGSGIHIERIAALVDGLNKRLIARAWTLVAPPDLVANSCLLVMGSEGRGEQIVKTDQDNALLLRDGFDTAGVDVVAQRFSAVLAGFGYPPCPGHIMLSNPLWCQTVSDFARTQHQWLFGSNPEGPMHLSIFFDAVAVAGDTALLDQALANLDAQFVGQDVYLARFAAAADQFHEPGNWFTRLTTRRDDELLDLKKLGTFPVVHGARALALRHGVRERGTAQRLQQLAAQGHLEPMLARELVEALHFLMGLRLSHQLRQRAGGAQPGNAVRASELAVLEREPLRDALAIVRRFRALLRQRFQFDML